VNQIVPEIIRIGVASARIKRVTGKRITYLDEAGQKGFVDLVECAKNWVQLHHKDDEYLAQCMLHNAFDSYWSSFVGRRGLEDDPPWVEFMNKRCTRFEFRPSEEARTRLRPLRRSGWRTHNTNHPPPPLLTERREVSILELDKSDSIAVIAL
jgi:hypothetical protein